MTRRLAWIAGGVALSVLPLLAARQPPATTTAPAAPAQDRRASAENTDEGIPVTDPDVRRACGSCHVADDKNRMTRISYRRATPENWELTIRRMVSLNKAVLTPEVARKVIKSLSDSHGLAPEEARPAMFEAERRLIDYTYAADKDLNTLCSGCHSMGRVISERRTKDEWVGLMSMHRFFYPGIDGASGGFRQGGPPGGRGRGRGGDGRGGRDGGREGRGDTRQPYEKAQEHFASEFPLLSPEWAAWSAAMRSPRLAGRWSLAGYQRGKGPIYGELVIADRPDSPDGFTTDGKFVYTRTGETFTRKSRAIVYTGFQWRGRSADAPDDPGTWREVALIERTGQEIKGRWFTGPYDETGIDVTLRRVSSDPVVSGTDVSSLKSSSTGLRVRIYGANLPARAAPADIDFGQGVKVSRVVSAAADILTVDVDVAADARIGPRDLSVAGSTKSAALAVYSKIDGLKVEPQAGMARLGGAAFPKRTEQFEARAFSNGPDGKPNTPDDVDLGMVNPLWTVEEYTATFRDDDLRFVGQLNESGLFTPNIDGPNANRSGNRNNVGDVWVVASFLPPGSEPSAKPIRARAHLLVTVPLYLDWSYREVGR